MGEDGWIVTHATYRLPGRSAYIRWCRSFVHFCKGRAKKARGSDELPGPQRRTETRETGPETSGERTAQASGRRLLQSSPRGTIGNGTSPWKTVREEQQARQEAVEEQLQAYRSALPTLLKRLGEIGDPRNPKTIRHKSTVLLLYGILLFVFQMASRLEANRHNDLD